MQALRLCAKRNKPRNNVDLTLSLLQRQAYIVPWRKLVGLPQGDATQEARNEQ